MSSSRARRARRLMQRIEAAGSDRREAWAEGDHRNVVHQRTAELDVLHEDKREMRREVYRAAPDLEGLDVRRGNPSGGTR